MPDSNAARIWDQVAERAALRGAPPAVADICAVVVATAAVTGAGVTAHGMNGASASHVICVTDDTSELLEELQVTMGEGPCIEAAAAGAPVLTADLGAWDATSRWPGFAPAALRAGARAMFALPLQIGAIRAGVLALYRATPEPLSTTELGAALISADLATVLMLDSQDGAAPGADGDPMAAAQAVELGEHRAQIDQATGMLTEQLGVGIDEAFIRLRAYAYAQNERLADVSRAIVGRRLRLRAADPPRDDAE
ncbi:MAG: GAF and ANTAR domain-containing protein [Streptosporangiaceae bacterium]|jgi:hypothetical protein